MREKLETKDEREVSRAPGPGALALAGLREVLEIEAGWRVDEPSGFSWWADRLMQRAWHEPARPAGGRERERVLARTRVLTALEPHPDTATRLAELNRHAVLGAWLLQPASGELDLVSTAQLDPGHAWLEPWWILAAALQIAQAEAQATSLAGRLGGRVADGGHPERGPRDEPAPALGLAGDVVHVGRSQACPLHLEDFRSAALDAEGDWLFPQPEPDGLGALVPLDPDMPAGDFLEAAQDGGTASPAAVLRLQSGVEHPALGGGLALLLRLPGEPGADAAARAAALNRAEAEPESELSLIGAWTADGRGLAWMAFLPSLLWLETAADERPTCLHGLLTEMAARVPWACSLLDRPRP